MGIMTSINRRLSRDLYDFHKGKIFHDLPQTAFSKNDFPRNRRTEKWHGESREYIHTISPLLCVRLTIDLCSTLY